MAKKDPMVQSIGMYFVTLEKKFSDVLAVPPGQRPQGTEDTVKRIAELLTKQDTTSWHDAYLAEQLMASVLPEAVLEQEIQRNLPKAAKQLDPEMAAAYKGNMPQDPAGKRAQLGNLLADLQWAYNMRTMRRDCLRRATLTGSLFFGGAFLFFALVLIIGDLTCLMDQLGDFLLPHALAAGLLGASYSTLTSLRAPLDDMPIEKYQTMCSGRYILSRILIGLCAALVFYFVLQAGLLEGVLLPQIADFAAQAKVTDELWKETINALGKMVCSKIDAVELRTLVQQLMDEAQKEFSLWMTSHSLVVVYCFLAGFSEKLVPNLLTRVEKRVTAKDGD